MPTDTAVPGVAGYLRVVRQRPARWGAQQAPVLTLLGPAIACLFPLRPLGAADDGRAEQRVLHGLVPRQARKSWVQERRPAVGPARAMPVIATASQRRPTSFRWRSARARPPSANAICGYLPSAPGWRCRCGPVSCYGGPRGPASDRHGGRVSQNGGKVAHQGLRSVPPGDRPGPRWKPPSADRATGDSRSGLRTSWRRGAPRALDREPVHFGLSGPALGRAQHDHRPLLARCPRPCRA
jgi:hypothetical protein